MWQKKLRIILIHSHRMAIVLTVVIFLCDSLREQRPVPLTKRPGSACFKNPCGAPASCDTLFESCCLSHFWSQVDIYPIVSLLIKYFPFYFWFYSWLREDCQALTSVTLLVVCHSTRWKAPGLVSGWGTGLGCSPQPGPVREATYWCFLQCFPTFSLKK